MPYSVEGSTGTWEVVNFPQDDDYAARGKRVHRMPKSAMVARFRRWELAG